MQRESETFVARRGRHTRHDTVATIGELRERFATFRRENPRFSQIPGDLRAAVLAAVRKGATPACLRRACGLTRKQVTRWQLGSKERTQSTAVAGKPARVFSVVDQQLPRPCSEGVGTGRADELELRLGRWSVSVRLAEALTDERG